MTDVLTWIGPALREAIGPAEQQYLKDEGRNLAHLTLYEIDRGLASDKPPNPWISAIIDPIVTPVVDGFKDELKIELWPWAVGAAVLFALLLFTAYTLGKHS